MSYEPVITFNPQVQSGGPTIGASRVPVWCISKAWWQRCFETPAAIERGYPGGDLPVLLVACWWEGTYGTRKWRLIYGPWAKANFGHLWRGEWAAATLPPMKPE